MKAALLVTVLAVPFIAHGADLPVSYRVDDKALKAGAVAGTTLAFELFTDAACTNLAHSASVAIEDVDVAQRLKLFTPSGGVKAPKTIDLRHTLTGVTTEGNLYLKVTGTGVTPVGGACQAQGVLGNPPVNLPYKSATLRFGATSSSWAWEIVNAADFDLGSVANVAASTSAVANVVLGLDTRLLYTCDVQVSSKLSILTSSGFFAPVWGIKNCVGLAPTCSDGIKNQGEGDVDCGGASCPVCADFRFCQLASDCASGHCAQPTLVSPSCYVSLSSLCIPADCFNGIKDNLETDVDCGVLSCRLACAVGQSCGPLFAGCDCVSGVCGNDGLCQP